MLKKKNPQISVVMACYNDDAYVGQAIESILNQSFKDFEFIIVNDGSTDNSANIINTYDDDRIIYIERENGGLSKALNTGLKVAKGKYIARIDSDDIALPNRLQVQFDFMERNSDYVVIGSSVIYMDVNAEDIYVQQFEKKSSVLKSKILDRPPVPHVTAFFRRDIAEKVGNYYEDIKQYFEDHLLFKQMIKYGEVTNLKQALMRYRIVPTSITSNKAFEKEYKEIRRRVLIDGKINDKDRERLFEIKAYKNNNPDYKEHMYYLYIGKKYLWNCFDKTKARHYLMKSYIKRKTAIIPFVLFFLSFLPKSVIKFIYSKKSK
ncbi:MAG TPA: glycosyltransferase family 2 protein [Epulopiscium sp.]|nr:glycosyltransferase family 2 protein [Candidatus Epulonipiscium sp.]